MSPRSIVGADHNLDDFLIPTVARRRYLSIMESDDQQIEKEERGIYLVMVLAGLPIVGALLVEDRSIDGGNTLMLAIVALAMMPVSPMPPIVAANSGSPGARRTGAARSLRRRSMLLTWHPNDPADQWFLPWMSLATAPPSVTNDGGRVNWS